MTAARTDVTLDDLLASPATPAAQTLLLAYARDPRVEARWIVGLDDADAAMRGTSARLLGLEGSAESRPGLRGALATEPDPHVRSELARALVAVGTADDDPVVLDALRGVEPQARRRILAALAVLRPESVLRDLQVGGPASVVTGDLATVLDTWLQVGSPAADRLMTIAALRPDRNGLRQLFVTAARWRVDVPAEALEAVWQDPTLLPAALAWLATRDAASQRAMAAAWGAALGPAGTDRLTAEDVVLFELRNRWLGQAPGRSLVPVVADLREGSTVQTLPDGVLHVLTPAERSALARRFDPASPVRAVLMRALYQPAPRGADAARRTPVHLLSDLPAGLAATLRAATGCTPDTAQDRVAVVRYDERGRPESVELDTADLPDGCVRYATSLVRLGWRPPAVPAGEPTHLLIRLGDAACDGPPRPPVVIAASPRELAADLARPRKVADRAPRYPRDLRARGVEGTVVIDTRIDDKGCVASAHVTGSVDPSLDLEAVRAVSSWRYAPATLDGTPVPVQMDVAVRFVLK